MTAVDWYPVAVKILGPQRIEGSAPPRDVLFLNGEISVDLIEGTFEFCETGYVGQLSDLDDIHNEIKADCRAVLKEYVDRPKWNGVFLSSVKIGPTDDSRRAIKCMPTSRKKGHANA
jgi:hypothetical protein